LSEALYPRCEFPGLRRTFLKPLDSSSKAPGILPFFPLPSDRSPGSHRHRSCPQERVPQATGDSFFLVPFAPPRPLNVLPFFSPRRLVLPRPSFNYAVPFFSTSCWGRIFFGAMPLFPFSFSPSARVNSPSSRMLFSPSRKRSRGPDRGHPVSPVQVHRLSALSSRSFQSVW